MPGLYVNPLQNINMKLKMLLMHPNRKTASFSKIRQHDNIKNNPNYRNSVNVNAFEINVVV